MVIGRRSPIGDHYLYLRIGDHYSYLRIGDHSTTYHDYTGDDYTGRSPTILVTATRVDQPPTQGILPGLGKLKWGKCPGYDVGQR